MIVKNLYIPLIPFVFDVLIRTFVFWNDAERKLSDYVDTNTLLVTVSVWMLFILAMSPKRPQIPTDTSSGDALETARNTMLSFVLFGLMTIGVMSILKAMVDQSPFLAGQTPGRLIEAFTVFSLGYFSICVLYVFFKSSEIRDMGA
jgi:hypothetical protein